MSKSLGNVVAPQDVIRQSGAEILRLWAMSSDYADDLRIGPRHHQGQCGILSEAQEHAPLPAGQSRPLRAETWRCPMRRCRSLSAICSPASPSSTDKCAPATRPSTSSASSMRCSISASTISRPSISISAKTRSIAIHHSSVTRRAALTVLDAAFSALTAWLAPMLCFTMEEAWLNRFPDDKGSVHLRQFPAIPAEWRDEALAEKWRKVRAVRRVVTGALEIERKEATHRLEPRSGAASLHCRPATSATRSRASISPRSPSPAA